MKGKNEILEKLRAYRFDKMPTYQQMAEDMRVSISTVTRWINNKEATVHKMGERVIKDYLISKGITLSLLFLWAVGWNLEFKPMFGEVQTVEMFQEFETEKEVKEFVSRAPKADEKWECEHWNQKGYCRVYNITTVENMVKTDN